MNEKNLRLENEIKELIGDVFEKYIKENEQKKLGNHVYRGRAESASSKFEDRFGQFLENVLSEEYLILVDYSLSFKKSPKVRSKTIYPDISIIKNNKRLVGIFETKIDIGYEKVDWLKKYKEKYNKMINVGKVKFRPNNLMRKFGNEYDNEYIELKVFKNIKIAYLILSGENNHNRIFEKSIKYNNCFALMENIHPNNEKYKNYTLNEFIKLVDADIQNLKHWNDLSDYLKRNFILKDKYLR